MEDKLAMYESLIPLAGIGIWERDLSNNKTYWNKMMIEILEADQDQSYTIEQILMLHKYPESIRQLIFRAQNSTQPETMVSQLTTFRKNVKWVRLRIQAQMEQNKLHKNIRYHRRHYQGSEHCFKTSKPRSKVYPCFPVCSKWHGPCFHAR